MAGRHAAPRRHWNVGRYFLPVVTAAVVVAIVLTAAGAGPVLRRFSTGTPDTPTGEEAAIPAPTRTSPSRASRGGQPDGAQRAAPSPSVSPSTPRPRRSATPAPATPSRTTESGSCQASFYSEGQRTANGEQFDPDALTAAHKTLPFDSRVRVTNPDNGKSVVVRINDRGPFVSGRCLDLSRAAFRAIASLSAGHTFVRYQVLSRG